MGLMNAFDSETEDSSPAIGRNLRSRPLARKKLSEMVEEELEQMIRRCEFGEGEQLPSERELMAFFNVGRPFCARSAGSVKTQRSGANKQRRTRSRLASLLRTLSSVSFPAWRKISFLILGLPI